MKNKHNEYATIILSQIAEMFQEDSENFIDVQELNEGDNMTDFFHALANIVPTVLFHKITGDEKNNLEFNHIANTLVMQYSKIDHPKKEENK